MTEIGEVNVQEERMRRLAALRRRFPKPEPAWVPGRPHGGLAITQINEAMKNVLYPSLADTFFKADPLLGYLKNRR